jgi:hypothetical protein
LAICQAQLTLRYDGAFGVTSEAVVFVLAGSDAARETVLAGPFQNVGDANQLANEIEGLGGKQSKGVLRLIETLRKAN